MKEALITTAASIAIIAVLAIENNLPIIPVIASTVAIIPANVTITLIIKDILYED